MKGSNIKHIFYFAHYNLDSPSTRYRGKYPLDFAKKTYGISSNLIIPSYSPSRIFQFVKAYFKVLFFRKPHDLIIIQRVHSNFIYSNLLKFLLIFRRRNTIYDLDDADYLKYKVKNIHFFARKCEFVAAGSQEIVKYFKAFNPNTSHVTSPIVELNIKKQKRSDKFTIGWIGGFRWGHKDSLFEYVFPALKALPFDCRFILMGLTEPENIQVVKDYFKSSPHIELVLPLDIDWNDEITLQRKIAEFDVGLATLANTQYHLSKSGIKAKQYMNVGVPIICNDLPENNNVVKNGINGFVCNSVNGFRIRIIQFQIMEKAQYDAFSKAAQESAKKYNHIKYFEAIQQLVEKNNTA